MITCTIYIVRIRHTIPIVCIYAGIPGLNPGPIDVHLLKVPLVLLFYIYIYIYIENSDIVYYDIVYRLHSIYVYVYVYVYIYIYYVSIQHIT